jgi:hypothetical protein
MKRLPPSQQEAIDPSTKPERLRALAKRSETLERMVAQNPNTPTDLLIELSKKPDRKIKEGLAKNPSTPPDILFSLVKIFPGEFLRNPVLDLLFVEDPNVINTISEEAFAALLRREEAPPHFFRLAYQKKPSPKLRRVMAQNPKAPTSILEELAQGADQEEAKALLGNPSSTPKTIAILITNKGLLHLRAHILRSGRLTKEYKELVEKVGLLEKPAVHKPSREELSVLAELGEIAQCFVAEHPQCPEDLLAKLVSGPTSVCVSIAQNAVTPRWILIKLADDRPDTSWAVAQNEKLPSEYLARLAASSNANTRASAAKNLNTPTESLGEMLFDPAPGVRFGASKNPNTPKEKLDLLFRLSTPGSMTSEELEPFAVSLNPLIRALTARHPNLPTTAIALLSKDPNTEVKTELAKNPALLERPELLSCDDSFTRFIASSRAPLGPAWMYLALHAPASVRLVLANNKSITAAVLSTLAIDDDGLVRDAAQQNEHYRDLLLSLSQKSR